MARTLRVGFAMGGGQGWPHRGGAMGGGGYGGGAGPDDSRIEPGPGIGASRPARRCEPSFPESLETRTGAAPWREPPLRSEFPGPKPIQPALSFRSQELLVGGVVTNQIEGRIPVHPDGKLDPMSMAS